MKREKIRPLIERVKGLILAARRAAATNINTLQVLTNFEIGRLIVEHEQSGSQRAEYGKEIISELAVSLTTEFGRGFQDWPGAFWPICD